MDDKILLKVWEAYEEWFRNEYPDEYCGSDELLRCTENGARLNTFIKEIKEELGV